MATIFQWRWWMTAVGPNIVASVVCFAPTLALAGWRLHRRWKRSHLSLHQRLDEIEQHITGPEED